MMQQKLSKLLLLIQALGFFTYSLAGIFLQLFLLQLVGLRQVILFNLVQFIFLLLFYLSSAWLLKKLPTRFLINSGLILGFIGWLLLLLLKNMSESFLIPFGIIFGCSAGLYWSGFNLSLYVSLQNQNKEKYFGQLSLYNNLAGGLGPFLGGVIIYFGNLAHGLKLGGYYWLFGMVLLLHVLMIIIVTKLPKHQGIIFHLNQFLQHRRTKNWQLVLGQQFILGLYDVAFNNLVGIVIFLILKSEVFLGTFNAIVAILAGLVSLPISYWLKKSYNFAFIGAVGLSLAMIFLGLFLGWPGLMVAGLSLSLAVPFLNIALPIVCLNTIDEYKLPWQQKYYLFLERDIVLGIGRIISFLVLFWLLTSSDQISIIKNWLLVTAIFPLILGWLIIKMKPVSQA